MAFTGPAGKADEWTEVCDKPYDGPAVDLPRLPHRRRWHPQVEAWWSAVRRMPHCVLWGPTDWMYALETAYMKQDWWTEYLNDLVITTKSTEIRRREDQMGVTVEARRKLRIRYVPAPAADEPVGGPAPAQVVDLDARRSRIAG